MICSLSRSHCTAAPAMKTLPSTANCGRLSVDAARVASSRIGDMHGAVGQLPDEPGVDVSEKKIVRVRPGVIDQPADFTGREISVDHQAGFALDQFARLDGVAVSGGPAALPYDRGRDRLAC